MKLYFNPPLIAHRGASGLAPENTMLAFTKAAQLGVKWIEFDVMLAKDGIPVIFHDDELERTTNGQGLLANHPFAYLRSLDAGKWFDLTSAGERIPSLPEVLHFLENMHLSANVEIKAPLGQEEALVKKVLADMAPFLQQAPQTVLFSSFSLQALQYLRKYAPKCLLGLLMHDWIPEWSELSETLNCVSVHVNEAILTKERAHQIKATNRALLSYTVNSPQRALQLFSYGVDAIFTDHPEQMLALVP